MNDSQRRKNGKLIREDAFMLENDADFPVGSKAAELTAEINLERASVLAFDVKQTSGFDDRRQAQSIYEHKRLELSDLIDKCVLAAGIIDGDIPGTAQKYKKPYPKTDQNMIAKATSFHADLESIKAQFEDAGFTAADRARLQTLAEEFHQSALRRDTCKERHAEASGGMEAGFKQLMELSKRRDKIVRMKYRDNPAKLAAWAVASHLERPPKRAKKLEATES